jgi:hypothetical protein
MVFEGGAHSVLLPELGSALSPGRAVTCPKSSCCGLQLQIEQVFCCVFFFFFNIILTWKVRPEFQYFSTPLCKHEQQLAQQNTRSGSQRIPSPAEGEETQVTAGSPPSQQVGQERLEGGVRKEGRGPQRLGLLGGGVWM